MHAPFKASSNGAFPPEPLTASPWALVAPVSPCERLKGRSRVFSSTRHLVPSVGEVGTCQKEYTMKYYSANKKNEILPFATM